MKPVPHEIALPYVTSDCNFFEVSSVILRAVDALCYIGLSAAGGMDSKDGALC